MEIKEVKDYYPFGMQLKYGINSANSLITGRKHNYGFGGKEEQSELGLEWIDITARNYDAAIGRWMNLDPLAEMMRRHSPYNFAFNNPIFFQDPDGMAPCPNDDCPDSPNENNEAEAKPSNDESNNSEKVTYENQPYAELEIGFGWTFGVNVEIGPIAGDINADFGTTVTKANTSEGVTTEYTEGWSIQTPLIGYENETSTDITAVKQYRNDDGTYSTPVQEFTTTQTNKTEINSMGGVKVNESTMSGTYTISEATQSQKGIKPGTNGITTLTTRSSGNFTSNGSSSRNSTRTDLKIGVGFDAGIRVRLELGIKDIPKVQRRDLPQCFVAGTKIIMTDGSMKNIENVRIGDSVKTYNIKSKKIENNKVLKIESPLHNNLVKIDFDNNIFNVNTTDHPYYVLNKGWCSLRPDKTFVKYDLTVAKLEIGDICLFISKNKLKKIKINKITEVDGEFKTYNLTEINGNHNFFANGVLVHNKLN